MKFAIVAVLLVAAVVGVYGDGDPEENSQISIPVTGTVGAETGGAGDVAGAAKGAIGGSTADELQNWSTQDMAEIQTILQNIVGPKISTAVTKLVAYLVNGALSGIPISGLMNGATKILVKLLQPRGIVEKILAGGDKNVFNANVKGTNGKPKNLSPADQARIFKILNRTVGPYTANYIVRIVTIAINGILGRIPLNKVLHGVTGLVENVTNPKGIVGQIIGQKGLGKPISQLLGAHGSIMNV